jgi:hypothetical protein
MRSMPEGMRDQGNDSNSTPPVQSSVLPGQFPVYRTYKPRENFENKAKIAWAFAMMGIIILPLGVLAAYMGADALAGINRAGEQKGRSDAMTALVLGIIETLATIAACIWYSEAHSFIRLLSK